MDWQKISGIAAIVVQCSTGRTDQGEPPVDPGTSNSTTPPTTTPPSSTPPSTRGTSTVLPVGPAVVRHGAVTVKEGESLSFASGTAGKNIADADFAFPGGLHQSVSAPSGRMKRVFSAATAVSWKDAFVHDVGIKASEIGVEPGNWYCLQSRASNVAAVLVDDYHYDDTCTSSSPNETCPHRKRFRQDRAGVGTFPGPMGRAAADAPTPKMHPLANYSSGIDTLVAGGAN